MNREETAGVLSAMRDTLKKVYLVAIDEERISALESAIGFLLAEDNNVPCKPSGRCGCGGKAILTDYTVEGAAKQYSVACETCFMGLPYGFDTPDDAWAAWRRAMGGSQPDPITGLVPCGCGGVTEQTDFHDGFFPHSKVECLECGIEIMRAGYTIAEAHDMAKMGWNTSRGYTAPPRPGAIGPDAGEMAPNGDEGATHE